MAKVSPSKGVFSFLTSEPGVAIFLAVFGLMGGLAIKGWIQEEQFATRPWVEEGFQGARRYTDETAARTLQQAIEHSDMNRREMTIESNKATSELKADLEGIKGKQDLMLDDVRTIKLEQRGKK